MWSNFFVWIIYAQAVNPQLSLIDLCGYVRNLLGVNGAIFNLARIAEMLEMHEVPIHHVTNSMKDEDEQLEIILQHWWENNDMVEDLPAFRIGLESLKQRG